MDAIGLAWLDNALRLIHGVGVLVTHDRALLDRHTQSTLRLNRRSAQFYDLPYSAAQLAWQGQEASARARRLRNNAPPSVRSRVSFTTRARPTNAGPRTAPRASV